MSYAYDSNNIAQTLIRAMEQGASYDEVDYLLKQRNRKIENGGAAMAQYKNDDLTKDAEAYLQRKITKPSLNLDEFRAAREEAAAENLRLADKRSLHDYQRGVQSVDKDAQNKKEALYAGYRKNSLAGDEALAANGLGKSHDKPSSGYGETAKTAMFLDYQNAVAQVDDTASRQKADLYADYTDRHAKDRQAYADARDAIAKESAQQRINQFNDDRNFLLDESKQNSDINHWNQEFDYAASQDEITRADKKEEANLNREHEKEQASLNRTHDAEQAGLDRAHDKEQAGLDREHESVQGSLNREHEKEQAERDREYKREESSLNRAHEKEMFALESEENKEEAARQAQANRFDNALKAFKETGIVSTQEMADALGLPVGTKTLSREEFENESTYMWSEYNRDSEWHDEEMRAKEAAAAAKAASSGGSKGKDFDDYYDLFKAVGEVITQEMANALGLPMGTKYWQYVESQKESERKDKETDFELGIW